MNCYVIRYVIKDMKIKTICSYVIEAKDFDSAYKQFKKDIKNGKIISVKIVNLNNLKKSWKENRK